MAVELVSPSDAISSNGPMRNISRLLLTAIREVALELQCSRDLRERVIGQEVAEQMIKAFLTFTYTPTSDSRAFA